MTTNKTTRWAELTRLPLHHCRDRLNYGSGQTLDRALRDKIKALGLHTRTITYAEIKAIAATLTHDDVREAQYALWGRVRSVTKASP